MQLIPTGVTLERCSKKVMKLTDTNYKYILAKLRRCIDLADTLPESLRPAYRNRLKELFQKSWDDFIWRTELADSELFHIIRTKERIAAGSEVGLLHSSKGHRGLGAAACKESSSHSCGFFIPLLLLIIILLLLALLCFRCAQWSSALQEKTDRYDVQEVVEETEDPIHISRDACVKSLPQSCRTSCSPGMYQIDDCMMVEDERTMLERLRSCIRLDLFLPQSQPCNLSEVSTITSSGLDMDEDFEPMFQRVRNTNKKTAKGREMVFTKEIKPRNTL